MPQVPSVGRIVHLISPTQPGATGRAKPLAAVITDVHEDQTVDLTVLDSGAVHYLRSVPQMSAGEAPAHAGSWMFPPHVPSTADASKE